MTFANLFPVLCFSQSMLMSIEINRNRLHVLRSLWSSIFIDISNLSIDSYWQISSTTDLSTSVPMIDFRSTCDVPKRLNVFNMNKCEPTIYSQLFPSLASFVYQPANQMIKFPPVADSLWARLHNSYYLRIWEYAFWRFCPPFSTCSVLAVLLFLRDL